MPVEKSLFTPKPTPVPTPTPAPVTQPTPVVAPAGAARPTGSIAGWILAGALGIGGIGYLAYEHGWIPKSATPAAVDTEAYKAGREFAPLLDDSLAQGFDAFAAKIDSGAKVEDANAALKQQFLSAREKAFADKASAGFAAIVPSGTDPKDAAARKAYSAYSREFAKGLRGTK